MLKQKFREIAQLCSNFLCNNKSFVKTEYSDLKNQLVPDRVLPQLNILLFLYSEHSSYGELQRFVKFLKLKSSHQILATVNVGNAVSRNAQKSVFKKWIEENTQSKLSKF